MNAIHTLPLHATLGNMPPVWLLTAAAGVQVHAAAGACPLQAADRKGMDRKVGGARKRHRGPMRRPGMPG